ncbi:MAG TPA: hypothetical protein ENJ88_11280 [Phaeodactylibacter sp.]|nr:hypothetical protein [Phaeodactylibacter sp.]
MGHRFNRQPITDNRQQITDNRQLFKSGRLGGLPYVSTPILSLTDNRQPTTDNRQPTTDNPQTSPPIPLNFSTKAEIF